MAGTTCDYCGASIERADVRKNAVPRPSDPASWCSTLWVCPPCAAGSGGLFGTDAECEAKVEAAGGLWWEG